MRSVDSCARPFCAVQRQASFPRERAINRIFLVISFWLSLDDAGESRLQIPEIIRMVDHQFGGPWTELKLDAVCYYLECYTKALTPKKFDLWYIDVFAGTGDRTHEKLTGGLLEREPMKWVTETLPGSAKRAMNIRPPFKHFIFNESDKEHQKALRAIKEANQSLDIEIIKRCECCDWENFLSRRVASWRIRRCACGSIFGPLCPAGGLGDARTSSQDRMRGRLVSLSSARCHSTAGQKAKRRGPESKTS